MKLVLAVIPECGIGGTLAALAPFLARNDTSLWFSGRGEQAEEILPRTGHPEQSIWNSREICRRIPRGPAGLPPRHPPVTPVKRLLIVLAGDADAAAVVAAIAGANAAGADSTGRIIVSPVITAIAMPDGGRDGPVLS